MKLHHMIRRNLFSIFPDRIGRTSGRHDCGLRHPDVVQGTPLDFWVVGISRKERNQNTTHLHSSDLAWEACLLRYRH